MTKQLAKTTEPDFRFTNLEDWKRYISRELFHAQNKVTMIKAQELFQPRLKITA